MGCRLALERDRCIEILGECGFLPAAPVGHKIPCGLDAKETERLPLENAAEIRGCHENNSQARSPERVNWRLDCSSISMSKITDASRDHIADENFAFPKERKEPIHDAAHVRNAIARFKQVQGVTDSERDAAWKRIKSAAKKHKVELNEQDWRELG